MLKDKRYNPPATPRYPV